MKKSRLPIVFLFSGQGSQYFQMGYELFQQNKTFREWMNVLDGLVREVINESVLEKMYHAENRKTDAFDQIRFTNPAIFMLEYSLARVLKEEGVLPDYVLGASLGELTAAAIAEAITLEDSVKMAIKHAEILEARCPPGGMLAILHPLELYQNSRILHENSVIAAINYSSHFVVSGLPEGLREIERFLDSGNITFQRLPITHGAHSDLMEPAREDFMKICQEISYREPRIPFVSCASARILTSIDRSHLWDVVRNPIRFSETIQCLEKSGNYIYLDAGPQGTLHNFVKYNISELSYSRAFPLMTPFGEDLKLLKNAVKLNKNNIKNEENSIMKVYIFPGQGSQRKGMGDDLFDEYPELIKKADEILGYSIKTLCLEDPRRQLAETRFTQPALYVVNALSFLKKNRTEDNKPAFLAGHSLGEYNALFAAGVFDFETGLKLVKKRGELMSNAPAGAMAAVLDCDEESIRNIFKENNLDSIDIANYNSPTQIVLAGLKEDIKKIHPFFEEAGIKFIPLNVSAAFHSRHMNSTVEEFGKYLTEFDFSEPRIPVISNVHARPYRKNWIKQSLMEQIKSPVKWTESIRYLMGKGEVEFEEVGPGNVLTRLVFTIQKEAPPLIEEDSNTRDSVAEVEDYEEEISVSATAEGLGSKEFKKDYNVRCAYVAGGMGKAIASKELIVRLGKAGLMGYYGSAGVELSEIEESIRYIQSELNQGEAYGINLQFNFNKPKMETTLVDLFLRYGIKNLEASSYIKITPALVKYRLRGLERDNSGNIDIAHRIMAKISRPEVVQMFLSPAPEKILNKMFEQGQISQAEVELAKLVPMADDICVQSDSGGHTNMGRLSVLLPTIIRMRNQLQKRFNYVKPLRVGAAGGIGTPEAIVSAFVLGADFVMTGSVNQCTVEAGTSDTVKDLLQQINVQDTDYAPYGEMFELGEKVQVLKKGVFFHSRANKLYDLWKYHDALEDINEKTRSQIQEKYFKRSFDDVYEELKNKYSDELGVEIKKAESNPKFKMALIFRWYFDHTMRLAKSGNHDQKVDYQVYCGPSMGAFNQWVQGTNLENWKRRHVDQIGLKLMNEAAKIFERGFLN